MVAVMELRNAGISLQAVQRAIEELRRLTDEERPLSQLMPPMKRRESMPKFGQPVERAFQCSLCDQAQDIHIFRGVYTIRDEHCQYTVKFHNPKLASRAYAPRIAAHSGQGGSWQCPACGSNYQFKDVEGGLLVEDLHCGVELICDKLSPIHQRSR